MRADNITLPPGWQLSRLDRVASVNARIGWKALTAAEYQPEGYAFLATPNIKGPEINFEEVNYISKHRYDESPELKLKENDVLLVKDGNTLGITNIVTDLPRSATVNGSIAVLRPFGIHPRFLRYVLASDYIQQRIAVMKAGMGVPHLFQWDIKRFPIPLPPLDEQRRIADFLDVQVSYIDRIFAVRSRQLESLVEREISSTFDAIRGVGEPGPKRSSGLAWLGLVPQMWPVAPVYSNFEVQLGKMLSQERITGDHLRPYLRNANVQWDYIDAGDLLRMEFLPSERTRYSLRPGDMLVCEGGEPGRAAIWDGRIREIYYQKALHRVRPRGTSSVRWLYYCLRLATALNVFAVEGNTTTIAHLTGEQLRAHRFPFPPRDDQDRIVRGLDEMLRRQRQLRGAIENQLQQLAERRQALIAAAMAGQLQ